MIESKCINNNSANNIDAKLSHQIDCFNFEYLGLTDFDKALHYQQELAIKAKENSEAFILCLEHPAVLTLGLRAHTQSLSELGVFQWPYDVKKINRGGLVTLHSPGQLVIYPIVDLKKLNLSVKKYVELLFLVTTKTLSDLGVEADYDLCDQPGVYIENKKFGFCGLQIKQGVTMHGLSLNISNDLDLFKHIVPCGIQNLQLTSLRNENLKTSCEEFFKLWQLNFMARLS